MKTVVGLLKSRDEAQFAVQDLAKSGFAPELITVRSSQWEGPGGAGSAEPGDTSKAGIPAGREEGLGTRGEALQGKVRFAPGELADLREIGMPEDDARYFAEGMRRGGYLVTVETDDHRAEEAAEIIRRHGAVEDERAESWRQEGWNSFEGAESPEPYTQGARRQEQAKPWSGPREPLPQGSAAEQHERDAVFEEREELPRELAQQRHRERLFDQSEQLPHEAVPGEGDRRKESRWQRDAQRHDEQHREAQSESLQRQAQQDVSAEGGFGEGEFRQEGHWQERSQQNVAGTPRQDEFQQPEAIRPVGAGPESLGEERVEGPDVAAMDDEAFERHFRATYGKLGERFDEPYRSAYHFAEAESASHPQFLKMQWYEVEEEIHQDWETSHPGTWSRVEDAIHFGWIRSRRHH